MSFVISNQDLEANQEMLSKVTLCYGDITAQEVDVILSPVPYRAKTLSLLSQAVNDTAGEVYSQFIENEMLEKKPGYVALAPSGGLPCQRVAACLTPKWDGGFMGEDRALIRCFENAIKLSIDEGARSIAVPVFLTGNHGYPKPRAVRLVVKAVFDYTDPEKVDEIRFVAFTHDVYELFLERLERYGWEKSI